MHVRRLLLDMIYNVIVQPEGECMMNINAIIVRGWRMASLLIGITEGLDILQHSPMAYPMGNSIVPEFVAA